MTKGSFPLFLHNFLNRLVAQLTHQQYEWHKHTVCMSLFPLIGALAPAQNGSFSDRVMSMRATATTTKKTPCTHVTHSDGLFANEPTLRAGSCR